MFKLSVAIATQLLCVTFFMTGCSTTGSAERSPLNPDQADAVVEVKGMSCPQCANNIALLMGDVDAIDQSRVDLGSGKVWMTFTESNALSSEEIADVIDRAGFTPGEVNYLNKGGE